MNEYFIDVNTQATPLPVTTELSFVLWFACMLRRIVDGIVIIFLFACLLYDPYSLAIWINIRAN